MREHELRQFEQHLLARLRRLLQKAPLESRAVDINQIIREVFNFLAVQARAAGVTLDMDPDSKPLPVRGDPIQLQQVVLNLVLNARDALRKDGRVVISTAVRETSPIHSRRATDVPPGRYELVAQIADVSDEDTEDERRSMESSVGSGVESSVGSGVESGVGPVGESDRVPPSQDTLR